VFDTNDNFEFSKHKQRVAMKKSFVLFSFFFYAFGALTGQVLANEKVPDFQSIVIKDAGTDDMSYSSTEPREPNEPVLGEACKGFSITEEDVREYLKLGKKIVITSDFFDALPRTRCMAKAELTTPDERKATMYIGRNRKGVIVFVNKAGDVEESYDLYCSECRNEAYYNPVYFASVTIDNLREKRQNAVSATLNAITLGHYGDVKIHKISGVENAFPGACKGFTLTETEIRDFFQNARMLRTLPISNLHAFIESNELGKSLNSVFNDRRNCVLQGYAVLQDEKLLEEKILYFAISRERIGNMHFHPQSILHESQAVIYYCDQCQSKKYYAPSGKILFQRESKRSPE
jgi:hypothetical protein